MMRCGKLKTGRLFSRRLKFWFYGGVSLILADFGISMAHAPDWVAKMVLAFVSRCDFADFRQDHQPPLDRSRLMYRLADHIHWRQFSVKCVA